LQTFEGLGNLEGRAVAVYSGDRYLDIASVSQGRFSHDPMRVLEEWDEFISWAQEQEQELSHSSPVDRAKLGPPVPRPAQIFAIGLNYSEHAQEAGYDTSGLPQVFTKFQSSLSGPEATVEVTSPRLDFEVELVVTIGRSIYQSSEESAWSAVAGLMVGQDFSARDIQLAGTAPQWSLGKSYRNFGPTGPYLVPLSQIDNPNDLALSCQLNKETVQDARTSQMIWSVPELIARLSSVCTLYPGDLIFTGTPAGVGNRRKPPLYLRSGDTLTSTIESVGSFTNHFIPPTSH
jgi:2-keto-4-pentenoate hydratase/2-oxohepta-3-ene-1,7-dioic acid hydratase in catechol pathway